MKAFSFTTILVLGGGACAAALSAAAMMAAAFATNESASVGRGASCLLFPGGPGAVLPTNTGFHSELYMLQTDVLSMTNLTGGAATAAASGGSPSSPHSDLYSDLQRGSGGENKIDIPAQHFPSPDIPIRCGQCTAPLAAAAEAIPTPVPLVPRLQDCCMLPRTLAVDRI